MDCSDISSENLVMAVCVPCSVANTSTVEKSDEYLTSVCSIVKFFPTKILHLKNFDIAYFTVIIS